MRRSFASLFFLALLLKVEVVWADARTPDVPRDISIGGRTFYQDGKPWLLKGIEIEGFNRPATIRSAANGMNEVAHAENQGI